MRKLLLCVDGVDGQVPNSRPGSKASVSSRSQAEPAVRSGDHMLRRRAPAACLNNNALAAISAATAPSRCKLRCAAALNCSPGVDALVDAFAVQ